MATHFCLKFSSDARTAFYRIARRLPLLVLLILIAGRAGAADLHDFEQHVRTTDGYLRGVMREAVEISPSFRALVDRLVESDVIVYVMRDRSLPSQRDGQINFITAAGGQRYLAVRVRFGLSPPRYAGIIAHELQHAVEIADAPGVVDDTTLAAEYERMGGHGPVDGIVRTFDTGAAILAGERAQREYESEE
jgi:hypothetical protein